jgi:iron complex transport system ATP-binding protein
VTSISVKNLSVCIGNNTILKNISATFPESTFVGIVGPNGSGKTTLIRTLNGNIRPSKGTISIGPHELNNLSPKHISKHISVVPQKTPISFNFTVGEIVEMGRYPYQSTFGKSNLNNDMINWALEQTDLIGLKERTMASLSGGEKARVLIARSLAQETPILLLDEPVASLDFRHTSRILNLIKHQVKTFEKLAIVVLHDLELAANFCDQILFLSDGEILSMGPPSTVLTSANISKAFDTDVSVEVNPVSGSTHINVIPKHI